MDIYKVVIPIMIAVFFIAVIVGLTQTKVFPQTELEVGKTLKNNTAIKLSQSNLLSGTDIVKNSSYTLVRNYDYKINLTTGHINLTNGSAAGQTFNVSYNYYAADYVTDTNTRTLIPLIGTAFVIFVFVLIFSAASNKMKE